MITYITKIVKTVCDVLRGEVNDMIFVSFCTYFVWIITFVSGNNCYHLNFLPTQYEIQVVVWPKIKVNGSINKVTYEHVDALKNLVSKYRKRICIGKPWRPSPLSSRRRGTARLFEFCGFGKLSRRGFLWLGNGQFMLCYSRP